MSAVAHHPHPSRLFHHAHKRQLHIQTRKLQRLRMPGSTPTKTRCSPVAIVSSPATPTSPSRRLANDPSMQSTWAHRAWVASGCTTVLVSLVKSAVGAVESGMWAEPLITGVLGYVLADLGTGVYHWAIDNYGDAATPVFGSQIEAFQGHHRWPWTITRRQFANNLHALARATTFVVAPMDLAIGDPVVHAFVGVCAGCIMFSQQFHAWAHGTKSRLPPAVIALQDAGLLISIAKHGVHHRAPYNNNYCIVSGLWNEFLDEHKVFEAMEMVLFFRYGVRPRSWSEPNSDWAEEIDVPLAQKAQSKRLPETACVK